MVESGGERFSYFKLKDIYNASVLFVYANALIVYIPVLSLFSVNPALSRVLDKPMAGASPLLPAGILSSPAERKGKHIEHPNNILNHAWGRLIFEYHDIQRGLSWGNILNSYCPTRDFPGGTP